MAKVLITGRDHRPIRLQPHVRDIRARYARALQLGYSPIDAAKLANGDGEIVKPNREEAERARRVDRRVEVEKSVKATPIKIGTPPTRENIPPNWSDLPWPQLRELATNIAGRNIRSRTDAAQVITDFVEPPPVNNATPEKE